MEFQKKKIALSIREKGRQEASFKVIKNWGYKESFDEDGELEYNITHIPSGLKIGKKIIITNERDAKRLVKSLEKKNKHRMESRMGSRV
jgi:hypothetical protein